MYLNVSDRGFPLLMLDSPRVMMVMKQPGLPLSGELTMPRAAIDQSHGTVVYR